MWRQVIDKPGSYPEFSATAMIARSMLLGIRNGWVDAKEYQPRVTSAWRAIAARISNGRPVSGRMRVHGKTEIAAGLSGSGSHPRTGSASRGHGNDAGRRDGRIKLSLKMEVPQ